MSEKRQFRAIKGTRDILPPDSALWNWFERTAREVFETYGFGEIRLPIFEETELFARSIGVDTDVVGKEMYTFQDYETTNELYGLWAVVFAASNPKNDEELGHFLQLVGRLIAGAKTGLETGLLARTPENVRRLDEVVVLRDRLMTLRYQGPRETDVVVGALRDHVRDLDFGESLTLRPEATASVARAYIEHGMHTLLRWADVSARAAAEGAVPAVLSGRRGGAGAI
jgi:histidyl-tRNA synthetase